MPDKITPYISSVWVKNLKGGITHKWRSSCFQCHAKDLAAGPFSMQHGNEWRSASFESGSRTANVLPQRNLRVQLGMYSSPKFQPTMLIHLGDLLPQILWKKSCACPPRLQCFCEKWSPKSSPCFFRYKLVMLHVTRLERRVQYTNPLNYIFLISIYLHSIFLFTSGSYFPRFTKILSCLLTNFPPVFLSKHLQTSTIVGGFNPFEKMSIWESSPRFRVNIQIFETTT